MLNDQALELRKLFQSEDKVEEKADDKTMENGNFESKKAKIITITSGKGGVGKSNFVVNSAITLQQQGEKVLIFDADIGMGNDDVLMNVQPRYTVLDLVCGNKELDEVLIKAPSGVHLLPGGSGINKIEDLDEEQREKFLRKLENIEGYDYIFIDTGAGLNKTSLAFMEASHEVFLITTPEPTSLTDGYSLLKAAAHYKVSSKIQVVINKASNEKEAEKTFEKISKACEHFLKLSVNYLGFILEDDKLVAGVKEQKPFILLHPKCNASSCIKKICKNISVKNVNDSEGIKGLFNKLFKSIPKKNNDIG